IDPTTGFEWRTSSWQGNGDFAHPEIVPKAWTLEAGPHQLFLLGRERGCEILSLSIVRADGRPSPDTDFVALDWTAHFKGFEVQTSPTVAGPWTAAPPPTLNAGRYIVALPAQFDLRLLRLSSQP